MPFKIELLDTPRQMQPEQIQPSPAQVRQPDSNEFAPHITVATVVENNGKYLFVQEKCHGKVVLNQPAGHLEEGENLVQAAMRETYEETGWRVEVTGLLGLGLYKSPTNGVTYQRTTFSAKVVDYDSSAVLDTGILKAIWLSEDEIHARRREHRSPLVMQAVDQHRSGNHYPLSILTTHI